MCVFKNRLSYLFRDKDGVSVAVLVRLRCGGYNGLYNCTW